jgi:NADPH2:quinone reductase
LVTAIYVRAFGDTDVMRIDEVALRRVGPHDVRVRVAYAGVNFVDVHERTGRYPRKLPFVPGREGSGVVLAAGSAVTHVHQGDRVAFVMQDDGSYAEEAVVAADRVVPIPDTVSLSDAAALVLQGITAVTLVEYVARATPDTVALVHSAGSGTASVLVQALKHAGVRVLGLVSTEEKARLATDAGADTVTIYPAHGFARWALDETDGRGADLVFDAVGGPTFEEDLGVLANRGHLIVYGRSGGALPPLDPARLAPKALSLTYARISAHIGSLSELSIRAHRLFDLIAAGHIMARNVSVLSLSDAASAHAALENRASKGKFVLELAGEITHSQLESP